MPRDPNRIAPMLAELEAVWRLNPDQRLGQLILNIAPRFGLTYVEDDVMLEAIKAFAARGPSLPPRATPSAEASATPPADSNPASSAESARPPSRPRPSR